jgi:hypothetical protein
MIRSVLTAALAAAVIFAAHAADSPFTGKWKFNNSKSKAVGQTDSIAAAGPNAWKFTYGSFSWTLKSDGTDQPTPFGGTSALKTVSQTVWQLTNKTNGKITGVDTWELSGDGKSMTRKTAATREDGGNDNSSTVVKRIAGTSGFEGTWQTTSSAFSAPESFELEVANDHASAVIPFQKSKWSCTFDGAGCKVEGPRIPPTLTMSLMRINATTLSFTWKIDGKVVDAEEWTVSGSTLTMVEHDPGEKTPYLWVFDRQ